MDLRSGAALVLSAGLLVGCASTGTWGKDRYDSYIASLPAEGAAPTMEQAQASAMAYFNRALKDPYSAKYEWGTLEQGTFRGAFERWGTPGWILSVNVNAKNSYGGYTGSMPYKVVLRSGYVVEVYRFDERANDWIASIGMNGPIVPPPASR